MDLGNQMFKMAVSMAVADAARGTVQNPYKEGSLMHHAYDQAISKIEKEVQPEFRKVESK